MNPIVFIQVKSRKTAVKLAPWAVKIVKCEGGFLAFRTWPDFETWKAQK